MEDGKKEEGAKLITCFRSYTWLDLVVTSAERRRRWLVMAAVM